MQAESAGIAAAVGEILRQADADIAARKPVCLASGRCCKFEEYEHRLYVTAAEMAHFSAVQNALAAPAHPSATHVHSPAGVSLPQFFAADSPRGCPYQIGGLCTAREARPLGCRLYFCDENAQSWQNEVYEKYHGMLRALHEQFDLPYRYLEWRAALRELV